MNIVRKHIDKIPEMSEERAKRLLEMSDEDIDFSDIPPLDEEFFKNAKRVVRHHKTEPNSIPIDLDILEWFKNRSSEDDYQTLINDVLRTYVKQNS